MHASFPPQDDPVVSESVFMLAQDARQALENLPMQLAVLKEDQDIVRARATDPSGRL